MLTLAQVNNHYLLTNPPRVLHEELKLAGWKSAGFLNRSFITDSQVLAEAESQRLGTPIVVVFEAK